MSVRHYVRTSVRPSTIILSAASNQIVVFVKVDETDIHDDMTFKVIRGHGQGQEMTSVPCQDYFYHAMHYSAKRGIAITCRLSVCL